LKEIELERNLETKNNNLKKFYEDVLKVIGEFNEEKAKSLLAEISKKYREKSLSESGGDVNLSELESFKKEVDALGAQIDSLKNKRAALQVLKTTMTSTSEKPVLPTSLKAKIATYNADPNNELYILSGLDLESHQGHKEIYHLTGEAKNLIDHSTEQDINQIYFCDGG